MEEGLKRNLLLAGAAALILLAGVIIFFQVSKPNETVNDFSKIPPKGIGKYENNDATAGSKGL
jgi:hypothetical protein